MNFLGFLVLLALTYTVGLDAVFGALDSVDQTLRGAYEHAVALHPPRRHEPSPPPARRVIHRTPWRRIQEPSHGR